MLLMDAAADRERHEGKTLCLFLAGDVMTGRGIDQVLPHPSSPVLYEPAVRSALDYVQLAEASAGRIHRPVDFPYIWGDALAELDRVGPDARIVNLETAVTTSEQPWPDKGINYRMHPANTPCLSVAGLDCCVLANNHVLDWGRAGLEQTLNTLHAAGLQTAGAGHNALEAAAPASFTLAGGVQLQVHAAALESSGVPREWQATRRRAGVQWLPADPTDRDIDAFGARIAEQRAQHAVVIVSIHWGGNWGYAIEASERRLAHALIDRAGVDLVHGHSSHHAKAIEIYRGKAIFYGCGDLLNDYEGIGGFKSFRSDLGLLYFPVLERHSGQLVRLSMIPTRVQRFRINRAAHSDVEWLRTTLERECRQFGAHVIQQPGGTLELQWQREP